MNFEVFDLRPSHLWFKLVLKCLEPSLGDVVGGNSS